jgi:hypothetical protein
MVNALVATVREAAFFNASKRLAYLEAWREVGSRPSIADCYEEDYDLLPPERHSSEGNEDSDDDAVADDLAELARRIQVARKDMNDNLPAHELTKYEKDVTCLVPCTSQIPNTGLGLFFFPHSSSTISVSDCKEGETTTRTTAMTIPEGDIVCYYCGNLHDFQSIKELTDKTYLMHVANETFIDPGPLLQIKARYINDCCSACVNCKVVPEAKNERMAIVAIRDIEMGDELFFSYGEQYWANQDYEGIVYTGIC